MPDILLAGEAGIGDQACHCAEPQGLRLERFQHRFDLLLVVGRLRDTAGNRWHGSGIYRRLGSVGLLEAAA